MAYDDYSPVTTAEDEEERKRGGVAYPPAAPPRTIVPPSAGPEVAPPSLDMPPVGNAETLKSLTQPTAPLPNIAVPQRPQWKDYAPPEPHGWAKFGHVMAALNPATNMIFNELPEQRAERAYKTASEEYGAPAKEAQETATTEHTKAQTEHEKAATSALENPSPKVGQTPEEQFMNDALHGDNGKPKVDAQGKPYTYLTAHQAWKQTEQEVKPEKVQPPHVTYDAGIPVSVTANGKTYDVNDPKLPPELKPLVDSANRAHGQHISEEATKTANANAEAEKRFKEHQEALTSTTKSMVEAAPKVVSLIGRVRSEIDKQEKELGPGASRWAEFMAGKVGAPNPEFTKLRTDVGLLTTLLMRMHVGARGSEAIMEHFRGLIDTSKQSPENLRAALEEIEAYANDVKNEGEAKGVHTGTAKPTEKPTEKTANEPERPTHVPKNYVYKENGPKGTGWYKP